MRATAERQVCMMYLTMVCINYSSELMLLTQNYSVKCVHFLKLLSSIDLWKLPKMCTFASKWIEIHDTFYGYGKSSLQPGASLSYYI